MIESSPTRSSVPGASARRQSAAGPKPARASSHALLLGLGMLSLSSVALIGCGAPPDDDDDANSVPRFGGSSVSPLNPPPSGASGAGAGAGGAAACVPGTANCATQPPQTSETINPNTPIVNTPPPTQLAPVTQACTPNQVVCAGNLLNTCNAAGTQISPQDCASNGGTCGALAGVPSCLAPPPASSCTPSQVSCEGANTVATCAANGSGVTTTRCPNGTVCEGNGTCQPVTCNPSALPSRNGGDVTVYWFEQGTRQIGDVACGFHITPGNPSNGQGDQVQGISNPELFGAMNTADYRGADACGACVQLDYQGRSVTITVVDECPLNGPVPNPTCTPGHIDLSRGAWNALTGNAANNEFGGVNWRFVPCTTTGNVEVELRKVGLPDAAYWNEFVVRNHRFPIAKAEVLRDGDWLEAERLNYNVFHPPQDLMGTFRVRLTDVNDGVVELQLDPDQAGFQPGESQFACQ